MTVLIIGGGQFGSQIANLLLNQGIAVKIIENRPKALEKLYHRFPKDIIIEGSGSDPDLLNTLDMSKISAIAALTGSDEVNLVISTIAKYEFGIPKVIARINSPRNAWLYDDMMGVDIAINQAEIMSNFILDSHN